MAGRTRPERAGEITVDSTGREIIVPQGVSSYTLWNADAINTIYIALDKDFDSVIIPVASPVGLGLFPLKATDRIGGQFNTARSATKFIVKTQGVATANLFYAFV